jgi:pimeloyl-ACP methyl ester carboxylesterase
VPDLPGIGRSSRPTANYEKKTQAADIRAVVTALGYDRVSMVSHDIGIMVACAYASRYADRVERLVVRDAPIPGVSALGCHCVKSRIVAFLIPQS